MAEPSVPGREPPFRPTISGRESPFRPTMSGRESPFRLRLARSWKRLSHSSREPGRSDPARPAVDAAPRSSAAEAPRRRNASDSSLGIRGPSSLRVTPLSTSRLGVESEPLPGRITGRSASATPACGPTEGLPTDGLLSRPDAPRCASRISDKRRKTSLLSGRTEGRESGLAVGTVGFSTVAGRRLSEDAASDPLRLPAPLPATCGLLGTGGRVADGVCGMADGIRSRKDPRRSRTSLPEERDAGFDEAGGRLADVDGRGMGLGARVAPRVEGSDGLDGTDGGDAASDRRAPAADPNCEGRLLGTAKASERCGLPRPPLVVPRNDGDGRTDGAEPVDEDRAGRENRPDEGGAGEERPLNEGDWLGIDGLLGALEAEGLPGPMDEDGLLEPMEVEGRRGA